MHQPVDNLLRVVRTNQYIYIGYELVRPMMRTITHEALGQVQIPIKVMRPMRRIIRSRSKYIPAGPNRNC